MSTRYSLIVALALFVAVIPQMAEAQGTATVVADQDNSLYQTPSGNLSNGAGSRLFVGRTLQGPGFDLRRALVHFDVASAVPPGAAIVSATLNMYVEFSRDFTNKTHTLHRVTQGWGEAGSLAAGGQGGGATALPGDATWTDAFFGSAAWATAGGDFLAAPSASASVGGFGAFSFGGAILGFDVQDMLDNPGNNFGWIILGDEVNVRSARALGSREATDPTHRPTLIIAYDQPVPAVDKSWGEIKTAWR